MFADHVLRKQESHLIQFQVCRQTKNLLLSSNHTMSSLPHWGNQAMPQWSRVSFPDLCHIYSLSSKTHLVHRKRRQGMVFQDSFIPHLYCAALRCFFFLKAATPFNSEPVLFRVLPGLFSPPRAELLEYICILNPTRYVYDEGTTVKEWGSRWVSQKTKELSGTVTGTGDELADPQPRDPTHDTVVRRKVNKCQRERNMVLVPQIKWHYWQFHQGKWIKKSIWLGHRSPWGIRGRAELVSKAAKKFYNKFKRIEAEQRDFLVACV